MTSFPYRLSESTAPTLGLIVLKPDETIEQDFRRLFCPERVKLHVTRIPSDAMLTPEAIARMETRLPSAAGLLPDAASFDTVGYACTSGTTLIGADRVRMLVQQGIATRSVTDPLTAALAAARTLYIQRLGLVSPYIPSVAAPLRDAFMAGGVAVPATLTFGEREEARVARIDAGSLIAAARAVAQQADLDGVFLSCTNLRTLDVLNDLEADLRMPVLSSNQVLAWHMGVLAGARIDTPHFGRLLDGGRATDAL